jgi:uncharacterized membrane protein SirB2
VTRALAALPARLAARRRPVLLAAAGVFVVYQILVAATLSVGLGGLPTYMRVYPAGENVARILRLTPSWRDAVVLIAREPLVEYGRLHPTFGAAVWSFELTWSSLAFYLSFSLLLGVYLGLGGPALRAEPVGISMGALGGAGVIGLLGASVSSLTHCGLGSFGVLLALAGVSTATIAWFAQVEPVAIPTGYGLMLAAIAGRAARLGPVGPGPR